MDPLTIYHNPSCKKSRAGKEYLDANGIGYTVIEYLKNRLSDKDIERLLVKMNLKAADLVRTQEEYYRQNMKGKNFNEHELVRIIVEQPKLLRRPIVEGKYRAVIGDPVDNIDILIK
jgi:arsenate reductase (glutaredoxin)